MLNIWSQRRGDKFNGYSDWAHGQKSCKKLKSVPESGQESSIANEVLVYESTDFSGRLLLSH